MLGRSSRPPALPGNLTRPLLHARASHPRFNRERPVPKAFRRRGYESLHLPAQYAGSPRHILRPLLSVRIMHLRDGRIHSRRFVRSPAIICRGRSARTHTGRDRRASHSALITRRLAFCVHCTGTQAVEGSDRVLQVDGYHNLPRPRRRRAVPPPWEIHNISGGRGWQFSMSANPRV